eukprot:15338881-Ditylum_brightwellii.AAC.1
MPKYVYNENEIYDQPTVDAPRTNIPTPTFEDKIDVQPAVQGHSAENIVDQYADPSLDNIDYNNETLEEETNENEDQSDNDTNENENQHEIDTNVTDDQPDFDTNEWWEGLLQRIIEVGMDYEGAFPLEDDIRTFINDTLDKPNQKDRFYNSANDIFHFLVQLSPTRKRPKWLKRQRIPVAEFLSKKYSYRCEGAQSNNNWGPKGDVTITDEQRVNEQPPNMRLIDRDEDYVPE